MEVLLGKQAIEQKCLSALEKKCSPMLLLRVTLKLTSKMFMQSWEKKSDKISARQLNASGQDSLTII